jgi:SPP1 family predicted phage head-tail adaptor
MHAGKLDQRITLTRNTLTDDGSGGSTSASTTYATVWANVRPMSGLERERSQRTEATSDYVVTIRNRDDVLEGDVIGWLGRSLNIRFVPPRPRSNWLVIEAEMGAAV